MKRRINLVLIFVLVGVLLSPNLLHASGIFHLRVPIGIDEERTKDTKEIISEIVPSSSEWEKWFIDLPIIPGRAGYNYAEGEYDVSIKVVKLERYKNSKFLRKKSIRIFLIIRVWQKGMPCGYIVLYPDKDKKYVLEVVQKKKKIIETRTRKYLGYEPISFPRSVERILEAIEDERHKLSLEEPVVPFLHPITFKQLERKISHVYYDVRARRMRRIETFDSVFKSINSMGPDIKVSARSLERHLIEKAGFSELERVSQVYPLYQASERFVYNRYRTLRKQGKPIMLAFEQAMAELRQQVDEDLQKYVKPANVQGLLDYFEVKEINRVAKVYPLWKLIEELEYDILEMRGQEGKSYKEIEEELKTFFREKFRKTRKERRQALVTYKNLEDLTTFLKTGPRPKGPALMVTVSKYIDAYRRLKLQVIPLNPKIEDIAKELGVGYYAVWNFLNRHQDIAKEYPTQRAARPSKLSVEDVESALWSYIEISTDTNLPVQEKRLSYLASLDRVHLPTDNELANILGVSRGTIDKFAGRYPDRIRTRGRGHIRSTAKQIDLRQVVNFIARDIIGQSI